MDDVETILLLQVSQIKEEILMRSLFHINCSLLIVTYLLPWISWAGVATISENSQEIVIDNSNYKIQLSKRNGGIKKISSRGTDISLS